MRLNTLDKVRDCLRHLEPRVELSDQLMRRALVPLQRMLAVK
jgi:quinolinate synthase